jgi:hypothetical protein
VVVWLIGALSNKPTLPYRLVLGYILRSTEEKMCKRKFLQIFLLFARKVKKKSRKSHVRNIKKQTL